MLEIEKTVSNSHLEILKAKLGITMSTRDNLLLHLLLSIREELEKQKNIKLDDERFDHIDFLIDYAAYRYNSKDNQTEMPMHLRYRLHNLLIENVRKKENVEQGNNAAQETSEQHR